MGGGEVSEPEPLRIRLELQAFGVLQNVDAGQPRSCAPKRPSGEAAARYKIPSVDCCATHSLTFPAASRLWSLAGRSLRSTQPFRASRVHAASKSYYRFPAIDATGHPALGRRRSRLRRCKAAPFYFSCFGLITLPRSNRVRSTLRPTATADQSSGNVFAFFNCQFNFFNFSIPLSMAVAATPLRPGAPYGRILAYGLPCPTLGRNPTPGLSWAATSMIAALLLQSIRKPMESQLAIQTGKLVIKWGPVPPRFICRVLVKP